MRFFIPLGERGLVNVCVQYDNGVDPKFYHPGTHLNAMKRFCVCSLRKNNFIHVVENVNGFLFTSYNTTVTFLVF